MGKERRRINEDFKMISVIKYEKSIVYMSLEVKILYIVTLSITITYLILKLKYLGYIFSFLNSPYLFYLISVFFIGPFAYGDKAWKALFLPGVGNYVIELNDMYAISLSGLLVMHLSMIYFEIVRKDYVTGLTFAKSITNRCSFKALDIQCKIMVLVMLFICLVYNNGSLPIFNKGRLFYLNQDFSYPYQVASILLSYSLLIYFFRVFYYKKSYITFLIIALLIFGTGTRGNLISKAIYPIFVFLLYYMEKNVVDRERAVTIKMFVCCIMLGLLTIWMQFFRSGVFDGNYLNEILYGNTFCDMRDGAFILRAFRKKFDGFLHGKTYFAALISFLPSKISKYKFEWGWGRFSAAKLIGWTEHLGFHAGNSTEAYFNFGWGGVVIFSILKGHIFASSEKIYRNEIFCKIRKKNKFDFQIIIILFAILAFGNLFDCTSVANAFWLLIAMILGNIVITALLKSKNNEKEMCFKQKI